MFIILLPKRSTKYIKCDIKQVLFIDVFAVVRVFEKRTVSVVTFFTFPIAFYFFCAIIILASIERAAVLTVNDYIAAAAIITLSVRE